MIEQKKNKGSSTRGHTSQKPETKVGGAFGVASAFLEGWLCLLCKKRATCNLVGCYHLAANLKEL